MRGQERAQLCLTSPHGEGTGRAMQGRERRKKAERPLASQGDGKVWNRVGFGGRGRLFPTGELIDPFRQIQVQHVDADRALARIVSLAAQAFHQRLGKGAVSPGLIFQRILLAGGRGEHHGTVLRAGQFVHHGVDVCHAAPGAGSQAPPVPIDRESPALPHPPAFMSGITTANVWSSNRLRPSNLSSDKHRMRVP